MTEPSSQVRTAVHPHHVRVGDTLLIKRANEPAVVYVAEVATSRDSYREHAGALYGGQNHVAVTTVDGAVMLYSSPDGDDEGVNELGVTYRLDIDSRAALVADSHLLDEIVAPEKLDFDMEHYVRRDFDFDDDDGSAWADIGQRAVLGRVLHAWRSGVSGVPEAAPAPTVSAAVAALLSEELLRERAAFAVIAELITAVRQHPKFPKSTSFETDHALALAVAASEGDPQWTVDKTGYGRDKWTREGRTLLLSDWAADRELDITDGPQVELYTLRPVMNSIRALRATAELVNGWIQPAAEVKSVPAGLRRMIDEVEDKLRQIWWGVVERG